MKQLNNWIWQRFAWPHFTWESDKILPLISQARLRQGKLLAIAAGLEFELSIEASSIVFTEEAVKTTEIEGELLIRDSVRSSIARHLGLPYAGLPEPSRSIDGLVDVLMDATIHYKQLLTAERLKSWQASLFPTGWSGLFRVQVGDWRKGDGPMQVVSDRMGGEVIHFEAVPSDRVDEEMKQFLHWWYASENSIDGLIRAALAQFYFVTIHPFDDGNGRIARALTDMALAQDEKISTRFYSLSSQIMKERKQYYEVLEQCQRGYLDVTRWLTWFLACFSSTLDDAYVLIEKVLLKAKFWQHHQQTSINDRQKKVLNVLLNAGKGKFEGGLTTQKYVGIAKVSRATAFREITDLLNKEMLVQNQSKGRSTNYDLKYSYKDDRSNV